MNVGEMLRERDRLLGVIDEAKTARVKLKQLNVLIALYGDGAAVEPGTNGAPAPKLPCEQCGAGPFAGQRGLDTHMRRIHGDESQQARVAQARKAAKTRSAAK